MKHYLKIATLALAITVLLSSCSKQSDPVSELVDTSNTQNVKVLPSGRLLFADNDAYNSIFNSLASKSNADLDKWENQLGFHSIRTVDANKQAAAVKLKQSFSFPAACATLISPVGEYQIGNRISWFHDGFRYVATSEEELAAIKKDVTLAKEKFSAGIRKASLNTAGPKSTTNLSGATTNATRIWTNGGTDQTGGDAKYNQDSKKFPLDGDVTSYRKINFESVMYVTNVTDQVNHQDGYNVYYTEVHINEYYEAANRTNGSWYRVSDYPRVSSPGLSGNWSVQGNNFYTRANQTGTHNFTYSGKGQAITGTINTPSGNGPNPHNSGDYTVPIAGVYLYSYHSEGDSGFTWTYNILGSYSSYVDTSRPQANTNNVHTEGGYNQVLW